MKSATTTILTIILASVSGSQDVPAKPNLYATCCKNNNGTYAIESEPDGEYGFCKTFSIWYDVVTGATFTEEQVFYAENCKNKKKEKNQLRGTNNSFGGIDRHLEKGIVSISGTANNDNSPYYVPPKPNPYATSCKNNNRTCVIESEPDGENTDFAKHLVFGMT